jgi:hypothetical protein
VPVLELNLMPGGSKLTASDVLDFFLHQAGHALAGPETASEGRYHGYKYKAAAEELGLDPGKYTTLGWKNTSLTEDTVALYEPQIRALDDALKAWEPTTQIKATRSSRNAVSAQCSCSPPRKIRLGEKTLRGASITCGACGQRFLPSG